MPAMSKIVGPFFLILVGFPKISISSIANFSDASIETMVFKFRFLSSPKLIHSFAFSSSLSILRMFPSSFKIVHLKFLFKFLRKFSKEVALSNVYFKDNLFFNDYHRGFNMESDK